WNRCSIAGRRQCHELCKAARASEKEIEGLPKTRNPGLIGRGSCCLAATELVARDRRADVVAEAQLVAERPVATVVEQEVARRRIDGRLAEHGEVRHPILRTDEAERLERCLLRLNHALREVELIGGRERSLRLGIGNVDEREAEARVRMEPDVLTREAHHRNVESAHVLQVDRPQPAIRAEGISRRERGLCEEGLAAGYVEAAV